MTANIFEKWILNLNKFMAKECCTIAMFIDNCSANPKKIENLKNIRLVFFLPNMTSKLPPMDEGVRESQMSLSQKSIEKITIRYR